MRNDTTGDRLGRGMADLFDADDGLGVQRLTIRVRALLILHADHAATSPRRGDGILQFLRITEGNGRSDRISAARTAIPAFAERHIM